MKTIEEQMANEKYVVCKIYDATNTMSRTPLHVGINRYSAWIPRAEEVVLAESLFNIIKESADTVLFSKPNKETGVMEDYTREHVNYSIIDRISAVDAHHMRLDGKQVFPQKSIEPKGFAKRAKESTK